MKMWILLDEFMYFMMVFGFTWTLLDWMYKGKTWKRPVGFFIFGSIFLICLYILLK